MYQMYLSRTELRRDSVTFYPLVPSQFLAARLSAIQLRRQLAFQHTYMSCLFLAAQIRLLLTILHIYKCVCLLIGLIDAAI